MSAPLSPIVETVICFHEADRPYLRLIETHLAPLCRENFMRIWHADKVLPGDDRESLLLSRLSRARLILLLVSADFNANWDRRIAAAAKGLEDDAVRVIPVLVRPCLWNDLPFFGLQPIPRNEQPLVVNGAPDELQFRAAAGEIRTLVTTIRAGMSSDVQASTVACPALFATLAQLERERHTLQLAVATRAPPPSQGTPSVPTRNKGPLETYEVTGERRVARTAAPIADPKQTGASEATLAPLQDTNSPPEWHRLLSLIRPPLAPDDLDEQYAAVCSRLALPVLGSHSDASSAQLQRLRAALAEVSKESLCDLSGNQLIELAIDFISSRRHIGEAADRAREPQFRALAPHQAVLIQSLPKHDISTETAPGTLDEDRSQPSVFLGETGTSGVT